METKPQSQIVCNLLDRRLLRSKDILPTWIFTKLRVKSSRSFWENGWREILKWRRLHSDLPSLVWQQHRQVFLAIGN